MSTPEKIEDLWAALHGAVSDVQRRVDASHPLDLYADYSPPDRPGLLLVCPERPPTIPSLKALAVTASRREDGRWALRITLVEPQLLSVFAELCRDVIAFTRFGVDPGRAAAAVLARVDRWQSLMQAHAPGLGRAKLRGLIGELLILKSDVIPALGVDEAAPAWVGPFGAAQDFRMPDGRRVEVKAVAPDAAGVQINGLAQLDGGLDPVELAVVRLEDTGRDAPDAMTAASLIADLRATLSRSPAARTHFDMLLGFAGWKDAPESDEAGMSVRLVGVEYHAVDDGFPRLTRATVPAGIVDASYVVTLPRKPTA